MPKTRTKPRKEPTQARARETVKAILDASARILIEEGYETLSTNKIAQRAGVSPGTLYQYFPNKESIIAALIDHLAEECQQVLVGHLARVMSDPLPRATRAMVKALVETAQTVEPELVRSLIHQVPQLGKIDAIQSVRKKGLMLAKSYLQVHHHELRIRNTEAAAFFVVSVAEYLTFRTVFERPKTLSLQTCMNETSDLLLRYLVE